MPIYHLEWAELLPPEGITWGDAYAKHNVCWLVGILMIRHAVRAEATGYISFPLSARSTREMCDMLPGSVRTLVLYHRRK
jgi:hypothetical protein